MTHPHNASPLPDGLAGARVLIVGGATGTGAAAARLLAGVGAHVLVASRRGALPARRPGRQRERASGQRRHAR
jgi:NAD(P)-dependent dehydrogenase (short-subunit alcohol dehydrogenase family)